MQVYKIIRVQPQNYLHNGQAVAGYLVTFELLDFNETHEINVPTLNNTSINDAIMSVLSDRMKLDLLGNIPDEKS